MGRIVLALVYTSIYFTLWIYDLDLKDKWLIYLTNQSMLLLVVHLHLDVFLALKTHNKQKDENCLRMSLLDKTSWCLANFTNSICPFVTTFYWLCFPILNIPVSFEII